MTHSVSLRRALVGLCLAAASALAPAAVASASALSASAPHHAVAHASGTPYRTYTVNTTADATLSGSAAAGTCHDSGTSGPCSLRAAVAAANIDFSDGSGRWDVIKVPAGTYDLKSTVSTSSLIIQNEGSLSVEGAGAGRSIINAADTNVSIFNIDDTYVDTSFSGLTFEHASANYGGAIYGDGDSVVNVTDCSFVSNYAADDGGAIELPPGTSGTVTDSTFTNNIAYYDGGAIYQETEAAPNETLTLDGDTFTHNQTTDASGNYGGGAVNTGGTVTVANSTFTNNMTQGAGGGIDAGGDLDVSSSRFTTNYSYYYGGAIYGNANVSVASSTLTSNSADDDGGAIYSDVNATLTGDTFSHNTGTYGGDLYGDRQATIVDSTFSHSRGTSGAGSLYDEYAMTVVDSTITDASTASGDSGGGIYVDEGFLGMVDSTITGTSAPSGDGGAIFCGDYSQVSLVGVSFTHDSAEYGGAVYAVGYDTEHYETCFMNVANSTISNDTGEYGGGFYLNEYSDLQLRQSSLENDVSTYDTGGAIDMVDDATLTANDSTFAYDRATGGVGYGGAIGTEFENSGNDVITLTSDTLDANKSTYGGALYAFDATVNIVASTIVNNLLTEADPSGYGGALYNNDSNIYATDSIFSGNAGGQCNSDAITSFGYNLDSDNTCGLHTGGDIVNHAAVLGPLANNGGPTLTMLPLSGTAAVGSGGDACPAVDQRGVTVPAGAACDIGAVFVATTTTTVTTSKASIVKGAEGSEKFTISVKGTSKPTGTVQVLDGTKVVCTATLGKPVGDRATATCSPGASTIKVGTATLTAAYSGAGTNAPSRSKTIKVKIT